MAGLQEPAPSAGLDPAEAPAEPRLALSRGVAFLRSQQDATGWWKGALDTNVTMDAEDLLMRQFLGIRTSEVTAATARWIRSQQREDGTWATFHGGPGDLSTTVEAYVALRLDGDEPSAPHMAAARAFVLREGGLEATRVFTRIWMALFGQWSWDDLPALSPEIMFLPSWFPLNLYDFACWARQTIAPLTIIGALRPAHDLGFTVDELRTGLPIMAPRRSLRDWPGRLGWLDAVLHQYENRPLGPVRRSALARAERWIVERQEADGSWGGIQPPWVYSLMALHLRGYALDHPVMRIGLAGLDDFVIEEDGVRRLEACQSPVWDTALAVVALADAGVAGGIAWSVGMQSSDGGWGAFDADNTRQICVELPFCDFGAVIDPPSADVTAHMVEMLALEGRADDPDVQRGVAWLRDAQEADGSWFGRWGVNHVYGTGAVVPALVAAGARTDDPAIRRAVRWLEEHQNADGGWGEDIRSYRDDAWIGRGDSTASQTAWALLALEAAGEAGGDAAQRGLAWLAQTQRADGSWDEPQFTGTGFPWDFSINYGLYRQVFPVMAMGRCLR